MHTLIHSPEPGQRISRLAPHDSVMEALNRNSMLDNELELSTASWQAVSHAMSPRPTSSVLSSDETDDDGAVDHYLVPAEISRNMPPAVKTISLNDDDKTIEIDMNVPVANSYRAGDSSSFVMPKLSSPGTGLSSGQKDHGYKNPSYFKILLIGNRKAAFFKMLDKETRRRFTLDVNDSYKIILVIFDGLVKIGNILNFIKHTDVDIQQKLFIPIFRNINLKIIEKILKIYKIELLCSPIHYDNKLQVQSLLEFLNEDLFTPVQKGLGESFEYCDEIQEYSSSEYQMVSSDPHESSYRASGVQKSVIVKHQIVDRSKKLKRSSAASELLSAGSVSQLHSMAFSKKLQSRKSKRKKYFTLSMSLTLGIGIGVASAYLFSLMGTSSSSRSLPPPPTYIEEPPSPQIVLGSGQSALKALGEGGTLTYLGAKATVDAMLSDLRSLKHHTKSVTAFLWHETCSAVKNINCVWDYWSDNAGKAYYNYSSLFWSF